MTLPTLFPPLRKAFEEIVVQNITDFQQQVGVNPFAAKDFVGILPRTAQLLCEPSNAASLPMKFFFDKFSDMRIFFHGVCLSGSLARWQTKRRNCLFVAYIVIEARQSLCGI